MPLVLMAKPIKPPKAKILDMLSGDLLLQIAERGGAPEELREGVDVLAEHVPRAHWHEIPRGARGRAERGHAEVRAEKVCRSDAQARFGIWYSARPMRTRRLVLARAWLSSLQAAYSSRIGSMCAGQGRRAHSRLSFF
jgi:hypothetical protein